MKKIKINNKELYTLVNDDIYEKVKSLTWGIDPKGYAVHRKAVTVSKYKREWNPIYLHQFVLGRLEGYQIDHINQDKLDNRRKNLRYCSLRQNLLNRGLSKSNTSGYKGVSIRDGKYIARIACNGKRIEVGGFKTAIEAAKVYNKMAKMLFKEFAWLNKI